MQLLMIVFLIYILMLSSDFKMLKNQGPELQCLLKVKEDLS